MADADKTTKNVITKIGSYRVGKTIGKGNFAIVKLAEHEDCKAKVAIKMIDKTQLEADNLLKVMREVRIMKLVNHTNIICLYEVMETERYLYLVTEFATKGEIFDLLIKNGRLHENEARKMFRQIISAMEYLHQKRIVHRDLKAENLLLDENSRIKLADFGFSTMFDVGAKLKTWCGSPPYAAPELFGGKEYYGPAADIWSMGVMLYVLVCGALPFDGITLHDLKQRVLAGKFRIPYFMSSDCESLIRHMLVVDLNKRFTMNQIKRHKWIIQGEPYDFLVDEDEFCFAQQHNNDDNGNFAYDEHILTQMKALGEDNAKVIDCLQRKTFDRTYGLYHILLDQRLRSQRASALVKKSNDGVDDDFPISIQNMKLNSKPDSLLDVNEFQSFESVEPHDLIIEEGEPNESEVARYLSSKQRRETIAVSHIKQPKNTRAMLNYHETFSFDDDHDGIPNINIHASPSPPLLTDTMSQLQYKEQYLPRPAVLQVRPQFDRRASDGSATLQDSIAQFNILRNNKKKLNSIKKMKESSREDRLNLIDNDPDSESEGPDLEAVQKYQESRGSSRRHTYSCILESTEEEPEDSLQSLKIFKHNLHRPKSRPSVKKLDRENRSPLPYLPVSPDSRRNLTSERRTSDGNLSIHLYGDKKKEEGNELSQLLSESKKLQDQYGCNTGTEAGPRFSAVGRRVPPHGHVVRENPFRYSYPGPLSHDDVRLDSDVPQNDPCLAMLHQKQEAQKQNLLVRFLVERKFLEKRMEEERRELIRRVSEGAPRLENTIADFLASRVERNVSPSASSTTELQDDMKKLNLQVSSGMAGLEPLHPLPHDNLHIYEERLPLETTASYSGSMLSSPRTMDIDEQRTDYHFANPLSLFNSDNADANANSSVSGTPHRIPSSWTGWSPNRSSSPFLTGSGIVHAPEIQSPLLNNGGVIWGTLATAGDKTTVLHSENKHDLLSGTLSVDITSSLKICDVVHKVKICLDKRPEINYSQSDTFFSIFKDGVQMEVEVYPLVTGGTVNGVKIRRVGGDKWTYKKIRDDILSGLYL